jgi:hypothetical protein
VEYDFCNRHQQRWTIIPEERQKGVSNNFDKWFTTISITMTSVRVRRSSARMRRSSNCSVSACCNAGPSSFLGSASAPHEDSSLAERRSDDDTKRQASAKGEGWVIVKNIGGYCHFIGFLFHLQYWAHTVVHTIFCLGSCLVGVGLMWTWSLYRYTSVPIEDEWLYDVTVWMILKNNKYQKMA